MQALREWFVALSVRGRLLSGCLGTLALAACCLYGLGAASYLVRPYLFSNPVAAATVIPRATNTLPPTPTQQPLITLELPESTLDATPTQAPIPTRAPTSTPTSDIPTVTPQPTVSETAFGTPTSTPVTPTLGPPSPTRTRGPTRTPAPPTDTKTPRPTRTPRNPTRTPAP